MHSFNIMLIILFMCISTSARLPQEYEEVDDTEQLLFTVTTPYNLAYTYQMKHAYMLGSHFSREPNRTMKNIDLVMANPINACSPLLNTFKVPTAVLIVRGDCSFTEKANYAQDAGAAIAMVTDISNLLSEYRGRNEFVNMIPDATLRTVSIPCVFISSWTGHHFLDHLENESDKIKMNIPVEKVTNPWFHHQKKAPWENWSDDVVLI